jgi:C4-dicarboxylate-specific signal transduction histidine kinase
MKAGMDFRSIQKKATAWLLPAVIFALAITIFIADTFTDLEVAVPAFYTAVVLLSVRAFKKRGVIFVGGACVALTLLSDLLTAASGTSGIGIINTTISLLAIITTTYLVLKIEAEREAAFEVRSQLAHVGRVTMLGELTASIAHEVNQPLAAVVINGNACLRWLAVQPPNLDEARKAISRLVNDANRASDIIAQVRALTKSSPLEKDWLDINEIILSTHVLLENEIQKHRISLQTDLARNLPLVRGDRVQLQQVVLNLILNAIEAVSLDSDHSPQLFFCSQKHDSKSVLISVQDSGKGLASENLDRMFNAFYTTKPDGMGMGLAISRSIIEAHGGRIWAMSNLSRGALFQFALPRDGDTTL